MGFTTCKDCIYGDCFGGFNRSCEVFPSIGKTLITPDNFFCFTSGKSKKEWEEEIKKSSKPEGGGNTARYRKVVKMCFFVKRC